MWCVLGTLGSLLKVASRSDASLVFRFRLSAVLPSARADVDEAGTDCPAEMSLEPLSGREGFEDEYRR